MKNYKKYICDFPKEQWPNVTFCIHYFERKCEMGCMYALKMEAKRLKRSKLEKKVNKK